MPNKNTHGGSRPVIRKDDGRLKRKLVDPVRVTIILERDQLEYLKTICSNLSRAVRMIIERMEK